MENRSKSVPRSEAHDQLRGHLLNLYAKVIETNIPAGNFLGGYFRQHKEVKGGARGFLAATLFSLLRARPRLLLLNLFADQNPPENILTLAQCYQGLSPYSEAILALGRWMVEDLKCDTDSTLEITEAALQVAKSETDWNVEELFPTISELLQPFFKRLEKDPSLQQAPRNIQIASKVSVAPELLSRWTTQWGEEMAQALAASYQEPTPLDLRVNDLKGSSVYLAGLFKKEKIEYSPCQFSPSGIRLERKVNLKFIKGLEEGTVEVQDQGSQLISVALAPKSWCQVLDACAGGGGKALHLAAMMEGRGRVYAHDLNPKRLEPLSERRRVANATNIEVLGTEELEKHAPYDSVLVDAPCLGLGRLRRDPAAAWRGGDLQTRLEEITRDQKACLDQYAPFVKPGGYLVYAVCCIEPEETTELLKAHEFLNENFTPDPLPELFQREEFNKTRSKDGSQVYLFPSLHGTDSFFIARFQRKKEPKEIPKEVQKEA